ncbi:putative ATP-dependent RNA helicase DDX49 [Orchesella cincta]|uniref:RNA helicase n=1 Tax=Orchesella cincta TaxID=48709 RepID=A0A1D2MRS6_ORCCI|nr:putative ATP-dependent RNA helicase DDX49 [Orchesella cincta]
MTSSADVSLSPKNFDAFGLTQMLLKRIKEEIKISKPTKVQAACIPEILKGRNCIAQAPTGSGKTMAFAIPMVQKWSKDPHGVYGLVLTPTRELGHQIKDQFNFLGGSSVKVAIITGGVDYQKQALELVGRPHFVVATPGRLVDLMTNGGEEVKRVFKNLRFLVLDEADRLLNEQFDDQLQFIKKLLPVKKQTLFFSATIADHEEMKQLLIKFSEKSDEPFIYNYQDEPHLLTKLEETELTDEPSRPLLWKQNLVQKFVTCPRDFKDGYLMELLRSIQSDNSPPNIRSMIIFATTCRECQVLSLLLTNMGFSNVSLHSNIDQKSRLKALSDFKSSQITTLIATDVASRGLDIKTVDLVINYSVPMPEDYVHRVGRTGRDTQKGLALMFVVPPRDIQFLTNIENYIRDKLTEMKIDERKVLHILTDVQTQKKLADLAVVDPDPFVERAKKKRKVDQ